MWASDYILYILLRHKEQEEKRWPWDTLLWTHVWTHLFLFFPRKDIHKAFLHHLWFGRSVCLLLWPSILQMWWVVCPCFMWFVSLCYHNIWCGARLLIGADWLLVFSAFHDNSHHWLTSNLTYQINTVERKYKGVESNNCICPKKSQIDQPLIIEYSTVLLYFRGNLSQSTETKSRSWVWTTTRWSCGLCIVCLHHGGHSVIRKGNQS